MAGEMWVTVDEVADHLKVKPNTVYKLIERNGLPAHRVGKLWRFAIAEVDAWIKAGRASPGNARVGR